MINGHETLKPSSVAQLVPAGRVPGITTAPAGIAAPLPRITSRTQPYTGILFEKMTPGAITDPLLTRTPSPTAEPAPRTPSPSIITGFIPTESSTPPICTPADRCTFLPT